MELVTNGAQLFTKDCNGVSCLERIIKEQRFEAFDLAFPLLKPHDTTAAKFLLENVIAIQDALLAAENPNPLILERFGRLLEACKDQANVQSGRNGQTKPTGAIYLKQMLPRIMPVSEAFQDMVAAQPVSVSSNLLSPTTSTFVMAQPAVLAHNGIPPLFSGMLTGVTSISSLESKPHESSQSSNRNSTYLKSSSSIDIDTKYLIPQVPPNTQALPSIHHEREQPNLNSLNDSPPLQAVDMEISPSATPPRICTPPVDPINTASHYTTSAKFLGENVIATQDVLFAQNRQKALLMPKPIPVVPIQENPRPVATIQPIVRTPLASTSSLIESTSPPFSSEEGRNDIFDILTAPGTRKEEREKTIKELLAKDPSLALSVDEDGNTPLMVAISHSRSLPLIESLIQKSKTMLKHKNSAGENICDLIAQDEDGTRQDHITGLCFPVLFKLKPDQTQLMEAMDYKPFDLKLIRLMTTKESVNKANGAGETPLSYLIRTEELSAKEKCAVLNVFLDSHYLNLVAPAGSLSYFRKAKDAKLTPAFVKSLFSNKLRLTDGDMQLAFTWNLDVLDLVLKYFRKHLIKKAVPDGLILVVMHFHKDPRFISMIKKLHKKNGFDINFVTKSAIGNTTLIHYIIRYHDQLHLERLADYVMSAEELDLEIRLPEKGTPFEWAFKLNSLDMLQRIKKYYNIFVHPDE